MQRRLGRRPYSGLLTSPYDGEAEKTGWPRGRWGWLFGSIVLLVLGVVFGLIFGSVWLGLALAVLLSLGWLMGYESWRGRNPRLDDPWDDGAQL